MVGIRLIKEPVCSHHVTGLKLSRDSLGGCLVRLADPTFLAGRQEPTLDLEADPT